MAEQAESKPLRKALTKLSVKVGAGQSFSDAAAESPDIFPKGFINMARAGEAAGNLDDIPERVAIFFEREYNMRGMIKSALTYPAVVGVMSIAVTVFLLVAVVPTFVGIFASMHIKLPLPTRIVLGVSHFVIRDWWIIVMIVVVLVATHFVLRRQEKYLLALDRLKFRVSVFGSLLQKSVVARMTRTLGSLFASAVPILPSLKMVSEVVDNRLVTLILTEAGDSLQGGGSLSDPLKKGNIFPPLVSNMVAIGEQTGSLDFMLNKIADFYESEVEMMADRLMSLIEPLMMKVVLAGFVGTIVTAVVLPEFTLYSHLQ